MAGKKQAGFQARKPGFCLLFPSPLVALIKHIASPHGQASVRTDISARRMLQTPSCSGHGRFWTWAAVNCSLTLPGVLFWHSVTHIAPRDPILLREGASRFQRHAHRSGKDLVLKPPGEGPASPPPPFKSAPGASLKASSTKTNRNEIGNELQQPKCEKRGRKITPAPSPLASISPRAGQQRPLGTCPRILARCFWCFVASCREGTAPCRYEEAALVSAEQFQPSQTLYNIHV